MENRAFMLYFGKMNNKKCQNLCLFTTAGSLKTKMMSAYMTPILTVQRPSFARSRSALDEIASRFGFTRG